MAFTITAESVPVYDTFGFSSHWECNDWILWHQSLVKKYGQDQADQIWANAWLDGLSVSGGGRGTAPGSGYVFDSVPIDCRTFNSSFKNYISANPILKDAVFSGVLGSTVGKAVSTGVGVVTSGTDIIDNALSGLNKFSSTLKWLIPLVAILAILALSFIVYKKYIEAKTA